MYRSRTTPIALGITICTILFYFLLGPENVPHVAPGPWRTRNNIEPSTTTDILALSDVQLAALSAASPMLANASPLRQRLALLSAPKAPHPHLGVASRIIVIGLARRTDRRAHMERVRRAMGLEFDWFDAIDTADPRVAEIHERVRLVRELSRVGVEDVVPDLNFKWSEEVQRMLADGVVPDEPVGVEQADLWTAYDDPRHALLPLLPPIPSPDTRKPLTHMSGFNITMPIPITLGAVSCWYSHYQVMRAIADGPDETVIVLEDDIDMEFDLEKRLTDMWPALPKGWDIVMLGHCQSHEWSKPALKRAPALHRSTHTMCTHAYAISKRGAQKMVRFLRSEHFAYSRPVDHTFIHLNYHDLTINFSILPTVVLQTKDNPSDVEGGTGGLQTEFLVDSALERVKLLEAQGLVEVKIEGAQDHL
ncbi:glycosyltransferase family 25 protein [Ceratobasidium sp. AG-Ba]|nr:glycosyltransferase family 25 protein [Ceratobasidium sp. AG-Ba]